MIRVYIQGETIKYLCCEDIIRLIDEENNYSVPSGHKKQF